MGLVIAPRSNGLDRREIYTLPLLGPNPIPITGLNGNARWRLKGAVYTPWMALYGLCGRGHEIYICLILGRVLQSQLCCHAKGTYQMKTSLFTVAFLMAPDTEGTGSESTVTEQEGAQDGNTETTPVPQTISYETDGEFNKALVKFTGSTEAAKKYARVCAEMGLRHFRQHGDTSYLQRFMDVIDSEGNKNWVRSAAFKMWLAAHAPITAKDKRLIKDKSENAKRYDDPAFYDAQVAKALATPFWEYAPSREGFAWGTDDVINFLVRGIKRFEGEKAHATSPEAEALFVEVKKAMKPFIPADKVA